MKRIALKLSSLAILLMMSIFTANAQHTITPIVPGCDGDLPSPPEITGAQEGHFGGFTLRAVYFDQYDHEFVAVFQYPSSIIYDKIGDGAYSIQCRHTESDSWEDIDQLYSNESVILNRSTFYRMIVKGGPLDGYVSNAIHAKLPQTFFDLRLGYSQPNFVSTGEVMYAHFFDITLMTKTGYGSYSKESISRTEALSHCHYQWYRQNPYTGEQTLIEGQTKETYVPTMEDVGYELVSVIYGDEDWADLYTAHNHGTVLLTILVSAEVVTSEGVIINTNYVLPNPEKDLWLIQMDEEYNETKTSFSSVKTLLPGQYLISMNTAENYFMPWGYGESPYKLAMSSKAWDTYQEFYLTEQYPVPIPFVVQKDGQNLKGASIDVYGKNLEKEYEVINTFTAEADKDTVFVEIPAGTYYFKAHQTESTAATYYPSALSMNDAEIVNITYEDYYDKYWESSFAFVIQAQAAGEEPIVDFNEDGEMNVTDVVTLINYIAKNAYSEAEKSTLDVNGDGEVNVTDVVTLILMIGKGQ